MTRSTATTHAVPDRTAPRAGAKRALVRDPFEKLEIAVARLLAQVKPGSERTAEVHASMQRLLLANVTRAEVGTSPAAGESPVLARPGSLIEEALQKSTRAHVEALRRAGLDASIVDLLRSWVELTVDARAVQSQIEVHRVLGSARAEVASRPAAKPTEDPALPLSAAELGQALGGLGDETVRQRERAGMLFSVLRPGRKRGREYPAFQAWLGIAGEPLERSLKALGPVGGAAAYGFFTSPADLLDGLTPIEALLGRLTTERAIDAGARALLASPTADRLDAVERTAQAYAAALAA